MSTLMNLNKSLIYVDHIPAFFFSLITMVSLLFVVEYMFIERHDAGRRMVKRDTWWISDEFRRLTQPYRRDLSPLWTKLYETLMFSIPSITKWDVHAFECVLLDSILDISNERLVSIDRRKKKLHLYEHSWDMLKREGRRRTRLC